MTQQTQSVPPPYLPGATAELPIPSIRAEKRWHTDALLLLVALFWGVNFSILKYATRFFQPLAINAVRIPVAAIAQLAVARAFRAERPSREDVWSLVRLGMIGNGVYQVLFIIGLSRSQVGTAALLIASSPAFIGIVGRFRGSEFLTRRQWGGIALQLAGCAAVSLGALSGQRGEDSFVGVMLILGACLAWAFYATGLKSLSHRVAPWYLGGYTMLGGAIVALVVGVPALIATPSFDLPLTFWLALSYSSFIAMVLAYLLYYRGLRVLGPTRTAMYSNLQPIIAMAVAWAVLHEQPTVPQVTGGALIVAGLLLTRLETGAED
jgi:drug/metabolite transporter (DMT)-like permease